MRTRPSIYLLLVWWLYNWTDALLTFLWDTYRADFRKYFSPEVDDWPPEPPPMEAYFEDIDHENDFPF